MKTIGVFADVSNLYYCISKRFEGRKLDYQKYLEKCKGNEIVYRAFAYGLQLNDEAVKFITCLKHFGYEPKYKKPRIYTNPKAEKPEIKKTSWNVGITLDVLRILNNNKLDVVIIGSADPELAPLVEYVKERGVQCVVMACGISKELKEVADEWVEIGDELLEVKE